MVPARILTENELRRYAPSVFALSPSQGVSSQYRFLPTIEVLNMIGELGFFPVRATQSHARVNGRQDVVKHMIRLRHKSHIENTVSVGSEIPEIVLTNSHDRSAAYNLMTGIFRLVCSNGMCVQSEDFGTISVRHTGKADLRSRVIDATYAVVDQVPKTLEKISEWKALELSPPQQTAFATAAVELLDNKNVTPSQLLASRRREDDSPNVWNTFNRIQENVTKGGIRTKTKTGRRSQTKPVKAVDRDVKLNKALWTLADELAKAVTS
jgi:hypothetical protein